MCVSNEWVWPFNLLYRAVHRIQWDWDECFCSTTVTLAKSKMWRLSEFFRGAAMISSIWNRFLRELIQQSPLEISSIKLHFSCHWTLRSITMHTWLESMESKQINVIMIKMNESEQSSERKNKRERMHSGRKSIRMNKTGTMKQTHLYTALCTVHHQLHSYSCHDGSCSLF